MVKQILSFAFLITLAVMALAQPFTFNDQAFVGSLSKPASGGGEIVPDVGWWKLNGDATDSSIGGNNGSLVGSPSFVSGANGFQAISLNGSSQSVSTPLTGFNLSSGSITFWMNPADAFNSGANRVVCGIGNAGFSIFCEVQIYLDNRWYTGWFNSPSEARVIISASSANYVSGTWGFYAVTWSPSGTILYQNGSVIGSSAVLPGNAILSGTFSIGSDGAGFFNGKLQDLRVYSRQLSSTEVSTLNSNGAK